MAKSSLPKIQQLNESNYPTWSQEMWAMLRGKGLWRLFSERKKKDTVQMKKNKMNGMTKLTEHAE